MREGEKMNLIDKDLLLEQLNTDKEDWNNMHQFDTALGIQRAINRVKRQQIVEVREHGHWVEEELNDWDAELISRWRCSVCNSPTGTLTARGSYPAWKACPECTAIMDEEEVY